MHDKLRIAFLEEWPSLRANKIMPYLAQKFDITYIAGQKGSFPQADFKKTSLYPAPKYINQHGIAFSRQINRLYSEEKIDFAVHYASIAYLTRKTPIVNFLGGSYYADFLIKWNEANLLQKLKLTIGFLHYTVPEYLACKNADMLIVNSHALKSFISEKYHVDNTLIQVVHNGIDPDFQTLGQAKQNNPIPKIIFVGRLHKSKGILQAVEAFHDKASIDAEFLIAGNGDHYEAIYAISCKDPRIKLLGHLTKKELLEAMQSSNIFLFPSAHEGCPNALLEAMAARHACICYDIPPVSEVLGNSGILTPTNEPKILIDELELLVRDTKKIHLLADQAHQESFLFSWEKCAKNVEQHLNTFAEKHCRYPINSA